MSRAVTLAHGGIVVALLVAGGCASGPPLSAPRSDTVPVVNPPRSDRGNPNFYEVFGRRYHVMPTADGYREDGLASWYGRDFHGRFTSSGERYDMFALTAAHKTLPLPTWVEVTNRSNGKRVIVKVNDRGPFVGSRIIDLSYAAALELDMVGPGTASVLVRALGAPDAPPPREVAAPAIATAAAAAPVATRTAAATSPEQAFVQVGAFSEHANAQKVLATLKLAGLDGVHLHRPDGAAGGVHRVHVGPFESETEFDLLRNKLRALGFADGHLVLERFYE